MAIKPNTAPSPAGRQGALARDISDAMAGLHRYYYGTEPLQVTTQVDGRFVRCVLVEPFTSYERELLSDGDAHESVSALWDWYQQAMADRFKRAIAAITGRDVVSVLSQANADPDFVVIVFELAGQRKQALHAVNA